MNKEKPSGICRDCKGSCNRKRNKRCSICFHKYHAKIMKGRKYSLVHRRRISASTKGAVHHNWKGDKVGNSGLHQWVKTRLLKPKVCDICKKVPPRDLANKGIYNRDLANWGWLCRKCHMLSDGRMDRLIKRMRERRALPLPL